MLNRACGNPSFQRLQASMREFDRVPMPMGMTAQPVVPTTTNNLLPNVVATPPVPTPCVSRSNPDNNSNWREDGDLRRLRSRHVVLVERMLKNHQPHEVLTEVPENNNWRSKTFMLALKIERLMFLAATSRENYLNEHTLRSRVQLLSRHLVRIRKRKNAVAAVAAIPA